MSKFEGEMNRLHILLLTSVITMATIAACPSNQDVVEYFKKEIPDLARDLSKITWHHAVNTEDLLQEALKSDKDMIESDLVHKTIDGKSIAVMGHNPEDAEDYTLTFEQFFEIFNEYNGRKLKGLKLDFKTTEAFEAVMESNKLSNSTYPVWINGDILRGPAGPEIRIRFNYAKYKSQLDCHVLSIGWTTGKLAGGFYSKEQIEEMRTQRFGLQKKTYPIRAAYLAKSWENFAEILLKGNEDTLTVWSPESDVDIIDIDELRKVLLGKKERIFVDLPENIKKLLGIY